MHDRQYIKTRAESRENIIEHSRQLASINQRELNDCVYSVFIAD